MASTIVDCRPRDSLAEYLARPSVNQLLTAKYMNEMPTAMITIRMANPILEKRIFVSNSEAVQLKFP